MDTDFVIIDIDYVNVKFGPIPKCTGPASPRVAMRASVLGERLEPDGYAVGGGEAIEGMLGDGPKGAQGGVDG